MSIQERFGVPFLQKPPGAGQTDPDTESKRAALLEKLQGIPAGNDSKKIRRCAAKPLQGSVARFVFQTAKLY